MISVDLRKLEFLVMIIVLSGYSKDVKWATAQNEVLMMKMVRLIKRALKRMLGIKTL